MFPVCLVRTPRSQLIVCFSCTVCRWCSLTPGRYIMQSVGYYLWIKALPAGDYIIRTYSQTDAGEPVCGLDWRLDVSYHITVVEAGAQGPQGPDGGNGTDTNSSSSTGSSGGSSGGSGGSSGDSGESGEYGSSSGCSDGQNHDNHDNYGDDSGWW